MARTRISTGVAAVVAGTFLLLGIATGMAMRARRIGPGETRSGVPKHQQTHSPTMLESEPSSAENVAAGTAPLPIQPPTLTDRLALLRRSRLERIQEVDKNALPSPYTRLLHDDLPELQRAVLKDLPAYLAFLRGPENEAIIDELLDVFGPGLYPDPLRSGYLAAELPPSVEDGITDLARSGTVAQKRAISRWMRDVHKTYRLKSQLIESCLGLLSSDDPRTQAAALSLLRSRRPQQIERQQILTNELWSKSEDCEVRLSCLSAFAAMSSPAGRQLFTERLSETLPKEASKGGNMLDECLRICSEKILASPAEQPDRYGETLLSAMRSACDEPTFLRCASVALDLPAAKAAAVLEQAAASAPTDEARAKLRLALSRLSAGEVRPHLLRQLLQ